MKKIKVTYWIVTILLGAFMLFSAIPDIFSVPDAIAIFKQLGYPLYLLPFLGIAKALGVVAVLVPGFPRLKEWAYAGFIYDVTGATYSSISIGAPTSGLLFMILPYALIIGSYVLYHKKQKAAVPSLA